MTVLRRETEPRSAGTSSHLSSLGVQTAVFAQKLGPGAAREVGVPAGPSGAPTLMDPQIVRWPGPGTLAGTRGLGCWDPPGQADSGR